MSLASMGLAQHPIVRRGVEFLLASVRSDASWPIDTNLATWNTTLAMNALAGKSSPRTRERPSSRSVDGSRETVAVGAIVAGHGAEPPKCRVRAQRSTASVGRRRARRELPRLAARLPTQRVHIPTPARAPAAGRGPICRAACPRPTTRPVRLLALARMSASLSAVEATSPATRGPPRRRVAARLAEQRRRLADVLPRLEPAAVRPQRERPDGPRRPALAVWQRMWRTDPRTRQSARADLDERIADGHRAAACSSWKTSSTTTAASCRCGSAINTIRKVTTWSTARPRC